MSNDSNGLTLERRRTAIVAMDLQAGVVSVYVKDPAFIARVSRVIADGRAAGVSIIYVKVAFRAGVPEASPRNRFLSAVKASAAHQRFFADQSGAIDPRLAPHDNDLVVTKSRISAFAGTDLELLLRAKEIDTLVVFGIATSGVVLATALEAADRDYRVVVVNDCCADDDADLHRCVIEKVLARLTIVASAADVSLALARST